MCIPVDVVDEGKMRAVRSWVGQTDRFVGRHQGKRRSNEKKKHTHRHKSGSSSASFSNGIVKLKSLKALIMILLFKTSLISN